MENKYSLTYPQKNIWMVEEFFGKSSMNTIVGLFRVNRGFNLDLCEKAVNKLVELNDALRLRMYKDSATGEVYQKITEYAYFKVDFFDLTKLDKTEKELNDELTRTPFDIIDNSLHYFAIVKTGETTGYILVKLHHLVADAWTFSNVAHGLSMFIEQMENTDAVPSYLEYIAAEKEYVLSERFIKDKEFWNEYLTGLEECVKLKDIESSFSNDAKRYSVTLDNELNEKLKNYCKVNRVSPYTVFMTSLAIYIHRVTEKTDFVIGTPVLNRSNAKEKKMMGMFVSTMPVRFKVDESATFYDMCKACAAESMSLFRHQKYPYSLIQKDFKEKNDLKDNLYSVMLSYQNARFESESEDKTKYTTDWVFSGKIQNELEVHIMDMDETGVLQVHFDYQVAAFEDKEMEYLAKRIFEVIKDGIENNAKAEDIKIMSDEEKCKILNEFNDTSRPYPKDKTVIQLFEEQVSNTPDKLAFVFKDKNITYLELDKKANIIANMLKDYGVKQGERVGIMQAKSEKIVESILGVLKAGAVYVPMDPNATLKTKRHIIQTANISVILSDIDRANIDNVVCLTVDYDKLKKVVTDNIVVEKGDIDEVNSIMFTSGTTGTPKGVMITNRNIIKLVKNSNYISFEKEDKMLQTGSFTFDASTLELWNGLLNGVPLYMVKDELLEPKVFAEYIEKNNITVIFLTAALFNQMVSYNPNIFKNVRVIMTGGESMSKEHADKLISVCPNTILKNLYGPTENAVVSTYHDVKFNEKTIPIGKAISNTKCFVLDNNLRPLPIGVKGVLYLGGDGLAKGYAKCEELTSQKFVTSEYGRIYNTGDLVRIKSNGDIEFLGRKDSEVKIKGMRVDLQEIKNIVNRFSHVLSSEVLCLVDNNQNKYLALAIVSAQKEDINLLKSYLKKSIAINVIPRKILQIDKMPLTVNGKVNKKKLEKMFEKEDSAQNVEKSFGGIYEKIYMLFKDVLGVSDIGMDDDFFDIGGDSLLAINVVTKAVEQGIDLTYEELYKCRSIREIGDMITYNYKNENEEQDIANYDYTKIHNMLSNGKKSSGECGDIILSGATGFLGMHILAKFIDNCTGKIYCLVRDSNNVDAKTRFVDRMKFYFDDKYVDEIDKRIFVVKYNGELDKSKLEKINTNGITHFINSLALVKHFGNTDEFFKVNVETVELITEFCIKNDIELMHISTLSVSGDIVETAKKLDANDINKKEYTEKNFYVGQELDNIYALTKFLAERVVLEKMVEKGLKARILRMGNLSERITDGKFQINVKDNAFSERLKSLISMGVLPEEIKEHSIDFTPVDVAAEAIITLLNSKNENIIYHLYNKNKVNIGELVKYINGLGAYLKFGSEEEISNSIKDSLNNNKSEALRGIMVDISEGNKLKYITDVNVTNEITTNILFDLGFEWPNIEKGYLERFIGRLIERG